MHIVIDKSFGFKVGTVLRNQHRMIVCDTPGGECFSYLVWVNEDLARGIELAASEVGLMDVQLGRDLVACCLARPQFILCCGLNHLGAAPTLEEAINWIQHRGGFERDPRGNWKVKEE